MISFFNSTFYFALFGAIAAAVKHTLQPLSTMKELSPVAISGNDKVVSDEALWWGCYAFSAMNTGFASIGLYAAYTNSVEAKSALLFGTGIMFEAFAVAWIGKGHITLKKDYQKQAAKVATLGLIFLAGFAARPS